MFTRDEITDDLLDRLVDGEMPDAERRTLLLALDARPDEWRRCALAFLEAQSWKEVLKNEIAKPVIPQPVIDTNQRLDVSKSQPLAWKSYLAVAASFLIAFSLATWFQSGRTRNVPSSPEQISLATNQLPIDKDPTANNIATAPVSPIENESPRQFPSSVRLSLVGNDNSEQSFDLPIAQDAEQIQSLLSEHSNLMSPHIQQLLERSGHRVEQRRQFFPVDLNDGRQIIVPVDEVQVQYVGSREVQ